MSLNEKAERLARTGAVTSLLVEGDLLTATVEGDTDTWKVHRDPEGWSCTCPANTLGHKLCSHIGATALYEKYGVMWDAVNRARLRMARRDNGREKDANTSRP